MTKLVRNPIDAHVGGQVKLRRAVVGMSQTELANRLGITFQQVQKYEKGANRIGASRLFMISEILNVPVQTFFEGAEGVLENGPGPYAGAQDETVKKYEEFIRSPGGIDLCKSFVSIEDPTVRKRIVALVKSVSGSAEQE
jgi:transcriptional regulator with XRE-family HTH domain